MKHIPISFFPSSLLHNCKIIKQPIYRSVPISRVQESLPVTEWLVESFRVEQGSAVETELVTAHSIKQSIFLQLEIIQQVCISLATRLPLL